MVSSVLLLDQLLLLAVIALLHVGRGVEVSLHQARRPLREREAMLPHVDRARLERPPSVPHHRVDGLGPADGAVGCPDAGPDGPEQRLERSPASAGFEPTIGVPFCSV